MSKQNKPLFNRKIYKDLKSADRQQMESFLINVYREGYNDGQQSVPGVDLTEIIEAIKTVKGIGEKRLQTIVDVVSRLFENQK